MGQRVFIESIECRKLALMSATSFYLIFLLFSFDASVVERANKNGAHCLYWGRCGGVCFLGKTGTRKCLYLQALRWL